MSVAEIYAGRPGAMLTERGRIRRRCMRLKSVGFQKKNLMLRSLHGEQLSARLRGLRENKEADSDENRHRQQLGSGWKRTLHDIQRLFLLPTFIFYAHFCFGLCGEKVAKFYSRLKIQLIVHEKFIIFGHLPTFCPLLKSKVGTAYN